MPAAKLQQAASYRRRTHQAHLMFAAACLMSSWPIKLVVATTIASWNAFQLPSAEVRTCFCSHGMKSC